MRIKSATATPFDEGKRSIKLGPDSRNPYAEDSVEHRNYELGRRFGLSNLMDRDRFRSAGPAA